MEALKYILVLVIFVRSSHCQRSGHLEFNEGKFQVDYALSADNLSLSFDVVVESQGWIGVGISTVGHMVVADIIAAEVITDVVSGEKVMLPQDYYSATFGTPTLDTVQNLQNLESGRNGTHEWFSVTRPIDTGDTDQDLVVSLRGTFIIWAYHETSEEFQYHVALRGNTYIIIDPEA